MLGAAVMQVLEGCGAQSRIVPLKPLTPSEARHLVKSFNRNAANPGAS